MFVCILQSLPEADMSLQQSEIDKSNGYFPKLQKTIYYITMPPLHLSKEAPSVTLWNFLFMFIIISLTTKTDLHCLQ